MDNHLETTEYAYASREIYTHAPSFGQVEQIAKLRDAAIQFHTIAQRLLPAGRHRALALTKIEEAVMWGEKAILLGYPDAPPPTSPFGDAPRRSDPVKPLSGAILTHE